MLYLLNMISVNDYKRFWNNLTNEGKEQLFLFLMNNDIDKDYLYEYINNNVIEFKRLYPEDY